MVSGAGLERRKAVARLTLAVALCACAACEGDGPVETARTASIALTPTQLPRLLVGDSIQMIAVPLDAQGNRTSGTVAWASSDQAVATITRSGQLIVVGTGAVTITASSDGATESLSATVSDPAPAERFAFAFANQPTAAAYAPLPDLAFNGFTKGPPGILVVRESQGSYRVRFRGLGRGPGTEVVLTSALGPSGVRCVPAEWGRLTNARDLDALVLCSTPMGTPADSPFNILVVGQASLPGVFAFSRVRTTAPPGTVQPGPSWSSSGSVTAAGITVGLTELRFGLPIAREDNLNTYVMAHGTRSSACRSLGRDTADVLTVLCTDGADQEAHADFQALAIAEGRPQKRFGMAYNDQAFLALYRLHPQYAKNSSGGDVTGHRHGTGDYRVTFHDWGTPGPQSIIVSAFVEGAVCNPYGVYATGEAGGDLRNLGIDVACFDSGGDPVDSRFTILVIE